MSLILGVGRNDANYSVYSRDGGRLVRCKAYVTWINMLTRCYSDKYQKKQPTYIGISVCNEWLSFMSFRNWWVENNVEGWEIDKDLISVSPEYSPINCIYVPSWLNCFTSDRLAARGNLPIGVSLSKCGRFRARCSNPITGKSESLGYFNSKDAARDAWALRKIELAKELKPKIDEIDIRIFNKLISTIKESI